MKTCSCCGKKYPDDVIACELDGSPLIFSKPITASRILSIVGFTVLAGLCGFGTTWLVIGFLAKGIFKTVDNQFDFAAKSMPILIAGGIIGFIIGLVVSLKVAKADPKTEEEVEKKYIGQTGRMKIYMGAPVFVIVVIDGLFFESFLNTFGSAIGACIGLGIALAIIAVSLFLYDLIPEKFIIPIGIIGWLLTLSMALWFAVLQA